VNVVDEGLVTEFCNSSVPMPEAPAGKNEFGVTEFYFKTSFGLAKLCSTSARLVWAKL